MLCLKDISFVRYSFVETFVVRYFAELRDSSRERNFPVCCWLKTMRITLVFIACLGLVS